jgi:hypothetical protein
VRDRRDITQAESLLSDSADGRTANLAGFTDSQQLISIKTLCRRWIPPYQASAHRREQNTTKHCPLLNPAGSRTHRLATPKNFGFAKFHRRFGYGRMGLYDPRIRFSLALETDRCLYIKAIKGVKRHLDVFFFPGGCVYRCVYAHQRINKGR